MDYSLTLPQKEILPSVKDFLYPPFFIALTIWVHLFSKKKTSLNIVNQSLPSYPIQMDAKRGKPWSTLI